MVLATWCLLTKYSNSFCMLFIDEVDKTKINSLKMLCRLCFNLCQVEYKNLTDVVYEICVKFFDPMFIYSNGEEQSKVICLDCWRHIDDFYNFQQNILAIHRNLEKDIKPLIKVEVEDNFHPNPNQEDVFPMQTSDITGAVKMPVDVALATEQLITHCDDLEHIDIKENFAVSCNYDTNEVGDRSFSTDDEQFLLQRLSPLKNESQEDEENVNTRRKRNCTKRKSKTKKTNINKKAKPRKSKLEKEANVQVNETCTKLENAANKEIENNESGIDYNADEDGDDGQQSDQKASVTEKTQKLDAFIAEWKQELDCMICNKGFGNFTELRKHFRLEHSSDKPYVLCCQRKFINRYHLYEHILLHIDPQSFRCPDCGKCSTNKRNLKKHIKEKHTQEGKERPFECMICHKRFTKKTVLKKHEETHDTRKEFECEICGKGFSTLQRSKLHERKVHSVDTVCDQCGKTIHGAYALRQHLLEHTGVKKPKWPCDQCNAELYSRSSLKRHKSSIHNDGSTVYRCSLCNKIAPSQEALRSHKKLVHQAERKYVCTICGKAFKVALVLREHMSSHTGMDLYQCPHCPKTFKVSSNMHHHRKRAHPVEWAQARVNKPQAVKVDINLVSNEIVI